jgi:hypothetical protein
MFMCARARRLTVLLIVLLLATVGGASAQTPAPDSPGGRLRVYLEACNCFVTFIRDEVTWVDFVRQRQDADLQVLGSAVQTGAGGIERTLRFVGEGRFAGVDFQLRAVSLPNESEDGQRRRVLSVMQIGLLSFAAREGVPEGVDLEVEAPEQAATAEQVSDPWNFWVFQIGADGSLDAEETTSESTWELSAEADRVTHHWILNFRADIEAQNESFDFEEDEDEEGEGGGTRRAEFKRRERAARLFLAKSLGDHWSVGFDTQVESTTFGNVAFSMQALPAVEYNLFPYSDYATRQLRLEYAVGARHAKYNEITIYDQTRETRPRHEMSATLEQRQPWGSIESRLEWSQYLDDLSLSRLEFQGEVSLRIIRGLSLDVGGSASRVRDQIELPKRGATPSEVLLRVRELQSGYQVRFFAGFSYSFGSIFNNIVNPRFGRNRGGGGGGGN